MFKYIVFLSIITKHSCFYLHADECANDDFVVHPFLGAMCSNDTSIVESSLLHMTLQRKLYEIVVFNTYESIDDDQEFFCKVNNTQYSGVYKYPHSTNDIGLAKGNKTIPIVLSWWTMKPFTIFADATLTLRGQLILISIV